MIKRLAVLPVIMLVSAILPTYADDAAPAATPQNLLNLIYVSGALVEFCKIPVDPAVATKIATDQTALEKQVGLDEAAAKSAYEAVKNNVATSKPDCSPTNENIVALQAMLKEYAAQ